MAEAVSPRELSALIDRLLEQIPASGATVARDVSGRWIRSECAGFFLLVPVIQSLRWPERLLRSRLGAEYGPRTMTYLLAGIAFALRRVPIEDGSRLDAGTALFAGWFGEPYHAGFERFITSPSTDERMDFVTALTDAGNVIDPAIAGSWRSTFAFLAATLVRAFAGRLRGFRQSSEQFIVRSFLNVPGGVEITPDRLRVVLDRNPLWVVVHLAGADSRADRVPWFGDRSVEFELEGL